jgi:uncharacterized protein YcfJ
MSKASFRIVKTAVLGVSALALLAGCVTQPMGPQVSVMPAPNKPFEVFQQDQGVCSQYAGQQVSGAANQANSNAFGTAVLGTILGAGLGAAIGGGPGAAIGAASGAVGGTIVGSGPSGYAQYGIQQQYDAAYSQCMYAKGNQVPGYYSQGGGSFAPPPPPPQGG